jgi:archaellum component FlaG (FlaF/FlaG flagellin family)
MSVITIAALVEAITGIATISSHVTDLIDQIQSRRRVRKEDIESLKAQISEPIQAQVDQLQHNLDALANTLDAYIRAYFDVASIAADCERLQMYVKENEADFAKKSTADRAWSNVFWMFNTIQREARNKYNMSNVNQSGLLDPRDVSKIEVYVRNFNTASNQAKVYIDNQWPDKLYDYVEDMAEESQQVCNVLHHQINRVLNRSTAWQ